MIHSGIKEEFSLYKKLWDSLDYGEKLDKSDTNVIFSGSLFLGLGTVVGNQLCEPQVEFFFYYQGESKFFIKGFSSKTILIQIIY